jgi:uncharacterized protein (DUF952 family)
VSRLHHLALARDWDAAQPSGAYTVSTLGRTLAEEGFIHLSRADQWAGVLERFYADVTEPLLLLVIDPERLTAEVRDEVAPGLDETFPHLYGPLDVRAVVEVRELGIPADQ